VKTSPWDFVLCGAFITVILGAALAVIAFLVAPLTSAYLGAYHAVVDFLLLLLAYGLLSALVVRALLRVRRIEPGEYAMESGVFVYWKLLTILYRLGQAALLPFTPVFVKPVVQMLFGAKIGANVALGGTIDDPYLVTLGDGVILGNASLVSGNVIVNGKIRIGEVRIDHGATIGANAIVLPGTQIGEKALVIAGAMVIADSNIPPGETWRGNPARKWM
jgi:acetyltransferase-like isoleucine patch superfamily enzyme